jgi:hypothetical protein
VVLSLNVIINDLSAAFAANTQIAKIKANINFLIIKVLIK